MSEQDAAVKVSVQPGNLVVDKMFLVNKGDEKLELTFKCKIAFKDLKDAVDAGCKYVIWQAQQKVRKAQKLGQPLPFPTNREFTMNSQANTELTASEKAEQAFAAILAKPELIMALPEEQKQRLLEMLKIVPETVDNLIDNRVSELSKLSMNDLYEFARELGVENYRELERIELCEEIAMRE